MANITLKLNTIETRTSATKGKYTYGTATILKKDGSTRETVVMAFGAQRESVSKFLRKGRKLTLNCVFDGGVLKILGPQRVAAEQPAEEAAAA